MEMDIMNSRRRDPTVINPSNSSGVCMMNTKWREQHNPSFLDFITSFLYRNSFRLNFVPIAPDFIFNCGGLSVAFILVTNWDCDNNEALFSRVEKLKAQFKNLYIVVSLPTSQDNDSFVRSYFKYGMEVGRPTFVQAQDMEMGFEKIVKIALSRGASKRKDVVSKVRAEKKQSVESMDNYLKVVTSIPTIDKHDANSLYQAIGSIDAIANASKESIVESTDLSGDKAETITRFFSDPKFSLTPSMK